jgi:hypothetical protein
MSEQAGSGRVQQKPPPSPQLAVGSGSRPPGQVPPSEKTHTPPMPHALNPIGPHEAFELHPPLLLLVLLLVLLLPLSQSHACTVVSKGTMSRRFHRHRMPAAPCSGHARTANRAAREENCVFR